MRLAILNLLVIIYAIYMRKPEPTSADRFHVFTRDLRRGVREIYGSAMNRQSKYLAGVEILQIFNGVSSAAVCLLKCKTAKPDCKAFNFGASDQRCILLKEALCNREEDPKKSLYLSNKEGYNYYDVMSSPSAEVRPVL